MEQRDIAQKHLNRMDAVVHAAEIKWGILMQLRHMVEPELAEKFDRQWAKLSLALEECRHDDVIALADGTIRGIWAMEAQAMASGHIPLPIQPYEVKTPDKADMGVCDTVEDEIIPLGNDFWANGGDELPF